VEGNLLIILFSGFNGLSHGEYFVEGHGEVKKDEQ
tara:strand:+ start:355 stop:459 length:105 start_codon:yes stop_codon:yes gene_type:complete